MGPAEHSKDRTTCQPRFTFIFDEEEEALGEDGFEDSTRALKGIQFFEWRNLKLKKVEESNAPKLGGAQ
ncbi:MAG: hypothetical protein CM15mP49_31970 [Actinomycetota bacterium]|nr:MAG: hypothetical protein CM15mP49_31970 [Actinomycetota bacterium]